VRYSAILATSYVRATRLRRGRLLQVERRKTRPVALRSLNAVKLNGTVLCNHYASSSRSSTTVDTRQ
jgi:hypothetical protein